MAYAEMFLRDLGRLSDAVKRMNVNPLGSGALASTTYPIDRTVTTRLRIFRYYATVWMGFPTGISAWSWLRPYPS